MSKVDYNTSATTTKPEALATAVATFKKVAFLSEYIQEDSQMTIEYQEETHNSFSPVIKTFSDMSLTVDRIKARSAEQDGIMNGITARVDKLETKLQ
ncbi:hypothetical protein HDU76_011112 [Blyttiomyces sp. JEL0837]|nr:hypothetical protein HDU76_011112 [Blyttiomyces sp. JEL0837]